MEIVAYLVGIMLGCVFIAMIIYEWFLWRKRTLAEVAKLGSEQRFFDAVVIEILALGDGS